MNATAQECTSGRMEAFEVCDDECPIALASAEEREDRRVSLWQECPKSPRAAQWNVFPEDVNPFVPEKVVQRLVPWDAVGPDERWLLMAKAEPRDRQMINQLCQAIQEDRVEGPPHDVVFGSAR